MSHELTTYGPVVQRNIEQFVSWVTVGGERQKVSFERPILWVQESESRMEYIHGGKVLMVGPEYSDYGDYLNSVKLPGGRDCPSLYADEYGVTPESSLEVRLVTTIKKTPLHETEDDREYNLRYEQRKSRQFHRLPDEWRKEEACEHSPTGLYYPSLEPITIVTATTWSSKLSDEENLALTKSFIEEWRVHPSEPAA